MRSALFVLLLLTSFALSGCTSPLLRIDQPPKQTILAAERIELPAVFLMGMPYVELKINGKGPYRFLVDTGAQFTGISERVAREAHVGVASTKVKVDGSGGSFEDLSVVTIDRLEAPGFTLKGFQSAVLGSEFIRAMGPEEDSIGGIIGMASFKQVLLEIDYPHQKVSVARLDSATPSLESGHSFFGTGPYADVRPRVKFAMPSAKYPLINVLIDTGSGTGFELSDITAFPFLVGLSRSDGFHGGIGGPYRSFDGQLNGDIRLGQATWRNPKISSANENRIGSEALAPWKLVIDQKRSLFWLVGDKAVATTTWTGPRDPDGRPSVYGFAPLPEGDSYIVKEVDPGSRAEHAGLKVGDRYTAESADSGKPGEGLGGDPTRIRLCVVRGEEKLGIVLSLLDPLPALSGYTSSLSRIYQSPGQTILAAERVELPTVFLKGMPYVELKINGKGPYRFLVDMGAGFTGISPRVAREVDIGVMPMKAEVVGSGESPEDLSLVTLDRLEAPGFTLKGIQVSVLSPETTQRLGFEENPFGGLIGMNTLNQVLLEIDYPHQKVSVARLDSATPALEHGHSFTGTGLYAAVCPQVSFSTPSAKHEQMIVLIDTGSEYGFELSDIAAFPVVHGLIKCDNFHHGIGGSWRPMNGQLNGDIRLGQATWRNPMIFSADKNRIGSEALAPWKLVIDPKLRLFWLVGEEAVTTTTWTGSLEPDGRPSVYGFAYLPDGDSFVVKEVDQGSRAERAGLKVGDRYTWKATESNKPGEGAGTGGERMRMHVIRGDEKLEIVLSLLD